MFSMFHIQKSLKILLWTNGLILLSGAMLAPIYALFVEDIGGSILDAGFASSVFACVAGITTLVSGKYADKIRENELIIVLGYTLVGVGFFLLSQVTTMYHLLLVQALIGFGEAVYSPAFDAVYTQHIEKASSGVSWGLWESMNYFVSAIGALIGGVVAFQYGFTMLFSVMAGVSLISAFYIVFLPRNIL